MPCSESQGLPLTGNDTEARRPSRRRSSGREQAWAGVSSVPDEPCDLSESKWGWACNDGFKWQLYLVFACEHVFIFIGVQLLYSAVLVSAVTQLHVWTCPLRLGPPSPLRPHRAQSWSSCAQLHLPASCLFSAQ